MGTQHLANCEQKGFAIPPICGISFLELWGALEMRKGCGPTQKILQLQRSAGSPTSSGVSITLALLGGLGEILYGPASPCNF